MKIVQVSPNYPLHTGGVQNVARQLSEGLAELGHEVTVLTSDMGGRDAQLASSKRLELNYLKSVEIAHTPIIFSLFFRLLTVPRDSIIHVHIARAFVPEMVYLAAKIRRIPYIAHYHSDVKQSGWWGFLLPLYKKLVLKKVLESADKVVVLTEGYVQLMRDKYKMTDKIEVIPNGVSREFFLKKKIKSKRELNLLFVGSINEQKNVVCLVKAMTKVKSKCRLHIAGEGELMTDLLRQIRNSNLTNIIIYGRKTGKELIELYRKADIFLLASKVEGLPLVLLEAMAAGVPVIASDVLGNRDLVEGVGILVNPPTPENFAKEIDNLIVDKNLRKDLSDKGQRKSQDYHWDKIINQFEQLYKRLVWG